MRQSGILMHITSLPGSDGIGSLGQEARSFVDFLALAGQRFWQVLPLGPTGPGYSPYSAHSAFAGNPLLLNLDSLRADGLLQKKEFASLDWGRNPGRVDYQKVASGRQELLMLAARRGLSQPAEALRPYAAFKENAQDWLPDYALFAALTDYLGTHQSGAVGHVSFANWPDDIRRRRPEAIAHYADLLADRIERICYLQYLFAKQFTALKQYADAKGVALIGDMPIYAAAYSADVWAHPDLFVLDYSLSPKEVAGCPPDYFSPTGQRWDNPLYHWEAHAIDGFDWWKRRIAWHGQWFHTLRLDHFRGFDSYYAIPGHLPTGEHGSWRTGPGLPFLEAIQQACPELGFIAEDLGVLFDSVEALRQAAGFPGMKVLQFAFDPREESTHLPHRHKKNTVVYTGTHDNDTIRGWFKTAPPEVVKYCCDYLRIGRYDNWGMIAAAWRSNADLAIAPMQDFLGLGSEGRMNTPGIPEGNWQWRVSGRKLGQDLAQKIASMTAVYRRGVLLPGNRKEMEKKWLRKKI